MSFSFDVKKELCALSVEDHDQLFAECYGMWLFSRCLGHSTFISENGEVVRRMAELAAICCGITVEIHYTMSRRKKQAYQIAFLNPSDRVRMAEWFGNRESALNLRIVLNNITKLTQAAFLRGVFLVCGTITDPEKEYHLELAPQFKMLSEDLNLMMHEDSQVSFMPTVTSRKGSYLLYIKDSMQIEEFMTYIGATASSMAFMQVKMYKELKNDINRKINFETANIDKTLSASARQMVAIATIVDTIGLDSLTDDLRSLVELRIDNPDMSLRDLGEVLDLSRSGVNHRMRKILDLGEDLSKHRNISCKFNSYSKLT